MSGLKVLIAANQIAELTGSELYVTELAAALAERGVSVALFCFIRGKLAAAFQKRTGIRVFGPADALDLRRFAPDIAHTHHVTTFNLMSELLPGVPLVHGFLGVNPVLGYPPATIGEARRVFAVSERVRDMALSRAPGLGHVEVVRNWFDDKLLLPIDMLTWPDDQVHKVLVVSSNHSPTRDEALQELEREGFISLTRLGGRGNRAPITGALLQQYDVVVTIGRTVLLAAAVGVPCIVADQRMSDGLLSHDKVDPLAPTNFTGRHFRYEITAQHIRSEILRIKEVDRLALSRKVCADYGLSSRARYFLGVYEDVLREVASKPTRSPTVVRGEGLAYLELARKNAALQKRLAKAARRVRSLQRPDLPTRLLRRLRRLLKS